MADRSEPQTQADGAGGRKPPAPPVICADGGEPPRRRIAREFNEALNRLRDKRR
jgi:hypothetical protein